MKRKGIGIAVVVIFGILVGCSLGTAIAAKSVMNDNAPYEQGWAYIIDAELEPGTPAYNDILAGHTAYQSALFLNQLFMSMAVVFGFILGGAVWEVIMSRRKKNE